MIVHWLGAALLVAASPSHAQAPPRLTGTLIAPHARQAIIDAGEGPQAVGLDDMVGPWRVQSIDPGLVRLAGPAGAVMVGLDGAPIQAAWSNPCGRLHPRIVGTHGRDLIGCRAAPDGIGLR